MWEALGSLSILGDNAAGARLTMAGKDQLYRFLFEQAGVRGNLVQLETGWQETLSRHDYPALVQPPLGEAICATVALSATIKFSGSLILQTQGEGPLHTIVAQATDKATYRGLARWREPLGDAVTTGGGRLVMTIEQKDRDRYQGIVPLSEVGIGESLKEYFDQSEQLPTRFWLAANQSYAAGLMLQRMPDDEGGSEEDWRRLTLLADTISDDELMALDAQTLLHRLFHEETLRLYSPEPVAFRCTCSRERIADSLRALGQEEVRSILEARGAIEADCEFCNRHFSFDAVDAEQLFVDGLGPLSPSLH